jgi:hypothetical protein
MQREKTEKGHLFLLGGFAVFGKGGVLGSLLLLKGGREGVGQRRVTVL